MIDERRRLGVLGALLDLVPEVDEEAQVGAELLFRSALGRGADDESARSLAAFAGENALQARRSSSEEILRLTPTWLTVGMNTRNRPGRAMWLVIRAPFLAMGSLAICTRISWPGFSRSEMMGRSEVCAERRDGPPRRLPPILRSTAATASTATTALAPLMPGVGLAVAGWRRFGFCLGLVLFVFDVEDIFTFDFAGLVVEVQLDAVVEVRFLQHLAQFAGADLGVSLLLFLVLVQVVFLGLAMVMTRSLEFFPFDDFLFNQARAGCKSGNGLHRGGLGRRRRWGRRFLGLLLAAKAKQAELAGRERVDVMRGAAVALGFFADRFRVPGCAPCRVAQLTG